MVERLSRGRLLEPVGTAGPPFLALVRASSVALDTLLGEMFASPRIYLGVSMKTKTSVLVGAAAIIIALTGCAPAGNLIGPGTQAAPVAEFASYDELSPEQEAAFEELATPITEAEAEYSENVGLEDDEVRERFDAINSDYELGEAFSEEDLEFIRLHATPALSEEEVAAASEPTVQTASYTSGSASVETVATWNNNWKWADSRKSCIGAKVATQGGASVTFNLTNFNWSINYTAKKESGTNITKMDHTVKTTIYGAVPAWPYVGNIYSVTRTDSASGVQSNQFNRSGAGTGAPAYYDMTANTVFRNSKGSCQIGL